MYIRLMQSVSCFSVNNVLMYMFQQKFYDICHQLTIFWRNIEDLYLEFMRCCVYTLHQLMLYYSIVAAFVLFQCTKICLQATAEAMELCALALVKTGNLRLFHEGYYGLCVSGKPNISHRTTYVAFLFEITKYTAWWIWNLIIRILL